MIHRSSRILFLLLAFAAVLGPRSGPCRSDVPMEDLIHGLGDPSWQVREECQKTLIEKGPEAIEALTQALRAEDPEVALRARYILGRIDPLSLQIRIQRIDLARPSRIAETLEGIAAEGRELQLPERIEPGDRSGGFAIQCTPAPERQMEITIEEVQPSSSLRVALPALAAQEGTVVILKRGEETTYRQIGFHLEREQKPFVVIGRWWPARKSGDARKKTADSAAADPGALRTALLRDLQVQAESGDPQARLAAVDLLSLLGEASTGATLRKALETEPLKIPALIGLVSLGDRNALRTLEDLACAEGDRKGSAPAQPRKVRTLEGLAQDGLAQLEDLGGARRPAPAIEGQGQSPEMLWKGRALQALVEAGSVRGFISLARRLPELDPAAIHGALSVLSNHLDLADPSGREVLLEGASSAEFLSRLSWDDPEVEHFFGALLERRELRDDGNFAGRLLPALARSLGAEPWYGPARPRALARICEGASGRADPAGAARSLLKDLLAQPPSPARLNEIMAFCRISFRDTPPPEGEFLRLLDQARSILLRDEGMAPSISLAASGLYELTQGLTLSELQLVETAKVLAGAAAVPNQPYASQFLREAERLTGLSLAALGRRTQVSGSIVSTSSEARGNDKVREAVDRWALDGNATSAAWRRLFPPPVEAGGAGIEYWEFVLLIAEPLRPAPAPAPPRPSSRVQVLDGRRLMVREGIPARTTDRWGNRLSIRLDPETAGGQARWKLNGQTTIEGGIPSFAFQREREIRLTRHETSDARIGISFSLFPRGQRLSVLVFIRRAGSAADGEAPEDPAAAWRAFQKAFLEGLSGQALDRVLPLIRDLDLRESAPFLGSELEKLRGASPPRPDSALNVARLLMEWGDPAGTGHFRRELEMQDVRRRILAAQALTALGDRSGLKALLEILRENPREVNIYSALRELDGFLAAGGPTAQETRDILDMVTANLAEKTFLTGGFQLLSHQAGTDFGFQDTLRMPLSPARTQAQLKAVEAARAWWASRRTGLPQER